MKWSVSVVLAGALGALAAMTAAQTPATAPSLPSRYSIPPAVTDGWITAAPEQTGIDRDRLIKMTDSIRSHPEFNVHAVLIEHNGRRANEEYFSGQG